LKYADDTVIVGLCKKNADNSFFMDNVSSFVSWCKNNFLLLNVKKTKELIIDFGMKHTEYPDIVINGEPVERTKSYKYLGVIIDNKLNWSLNADLVCSKAKKRLYFLRKLKEFEVDTSILRMFYDTVIHTVLTFALICWYGDIPDYAATAMNKVVRTANRIIKDNKSHNLTNTRKSTEHGT